MTIFRIITKLRHRHSHQIANRAGSHGSAPGGAGRGGAGRGATMQRIAVMTAVAMVVSAHAYATPPLPEGDRYAENFAKIVADNDFREHYDQLRRDFPRFDWHNNGCSGPAKLTGYADDFFWPCVQHDFGYRNAKMVHRHNETTRTFIDFQLLEHTKRVCSHRSLLAKPPCYVTANNFYSAVRLFGRSHF